MWIITEQGVDYANQWSCIAKISRTVFSKDICRVAVSIWYNFASSAGLKLSNVLLKDGSNQCLRMLGRPQLGHFITSLGSDICFFWSSVILIPSSFLLLYPKQHSSKYGKGTGIKITTVSILMFYQSFHFDVIFSTFFVSLWICTQILNEKFHLTSMLLWYTDFHPDPNCR